MLFNRVRSKYNEKESFDYINAPKSFASVTQSSIRDVRRYCLRSITRKFGKNGFKAGALTDMLGSINGEFSDLYTRLNDDYNSRLANLKTAYNDGCAELNQQVLEFEFILERYKRKLNEYSDIMWLNNGERPSESLNFDDNQIAAIKKGIEKMKEGKNVR